ncbi:MAG: DMT family transporter [Thermaerobacter sp.]|nr:DMT family transporter [Thermaerobacter sp.]
MVEQEGRLFKETAPKTGGNRTSIWWGLMALALLTAIWGYCNILIRQLEFSLDPSVFLLIRYIVVGLIGLPLIFLGPRLTTKRWLAGVAAGALLAGVTFFQAVSMESIPVDDVAFITALYVVLTPLVMAVWRRRVPHRVVTAAALASILGVALLVGIGQLTLSVAAGTFWALLAAVFATFQIIGTTEVGRTMTTIQLTILEALGAGLTLTVYTLVAHPHALTALSLNLPFSVWWRFGFLAILGTLVAGWLQVWGQQRLTATEAALAFNMEPVWTAFFAWLVFGQWLSSLKLIGAALIVASLVALSVSAQETVALEVPNAKAPYREH